MTTILATDLPTGTYHLTLFVGGRPHPDAYGGGHTPASLAKLFAWEVQPDTPAHASGPLSYHYEVQCERTNQRWRLVDRERLEPISAE